MLKLSWAKWLIRTATPPKRTMNMPQKSHSNLQLTQPTKQPSKQVMEVAAKILAKQAQKLAARKALTSKA